MAPTTTTLELLALPAQATTRLKLLSLPPYTQHIASMEEPSPHTQHIATMADAAMADAAMADATAAEPSEEEKAHYYHGLPSIPRLVARSNFTTSWAPMWEDNHPVRKTISIIGKQDVVQNIRDKYEPENIIPCLADIDWTTIDMVRIGTKGNTSDPIILWVGVKPGSLSWEKGIEVACCCRTVLLEAGLDIHCEIRESNVQRAASVISSWSQLGRMEPSLTAALGGQAIAAEKTPTKEGTLALYLLVNGIKCALVSRHAVGDDHSHIDGQYVIMPGQSTYEEICDMYNAKLATCVVQDDKEAYQKLVHHVGTLANPASRRIGHILLSPPCRPMTRPGHIRWLPDYAVVALDKERLYEGLSNTVQVDFDYRSQRLMKKYYPNVQLSTGPLKLEGTFSPGDGRAVGKDGRSTGLT
ncbi:hypothetical protein MFIFM68171_02299 [Madurella fahalii]|uniref:Uncharacterized protein n=1 Tax=Madurella fahalii TaxID=1157608 RepID=A0ABQ0G326_9PEZI